MHWSLVSKENLAFNLLSQSKRNKNTIEDRFVRALIHEMEKRYMKSIKATLNTQKESEKELKTVILLTASRIITICVFKHEAMFLNGRANHNFFLNRCCLNAATLGTGHPPNERK